MKIFNKFLYLVAGVTALTCCFGCGGNTPTPPGPTPPELPVTTIKAKDIVGGNSISFECTSSEEFTVNWGDGLEDHKTSHTYDVAIGEATITITGNIDKISFSSSSKVLANNDLITSVTLGESITTLPRYSFAYLKLTSITLNKTLTTIEEGAFAYCYSLPFIIIPKSVTVIDKYAFYWCDENLNIYCEAEEKPSDWSEYWNDSGCLCYWGVTQRGVSGDYTYIITTSGTYITKYNGDDGSVTIPDKIDDHTIDGIGMYAFNGKKATSITLPDTLTTIKDCAFYNCTKLTELIIPKSVTKMGDYVVYGCTSLTIYCEADSRPEGWSYAWNLFGCPCYWGYISKGTEGDFSYVTTKAGSNIVKYNGTDTATVNIPATLGNQPVISIGDSVFAKREDITAITLPDSLQKIGASAFTSCAGLSSINIPDGLKTIGSAAFYGCASLTEIIIPESVTVIETDAFNMCSSLTIYCKAASQPTGWSYFWNRGGCPCWWGYISKGTQDGYSYIATKAGSYITKYEGTDVTVNVPDKLGGQPVISIGANVFKERSDITAVTLPTTLQSIGEYAFASCGSLLEVIIPISVVTVGIRAFLASYSLTIYCEADSKPKGWDSDWNFSDRPCYWGYISKGKEGNYSYIVTKAGSYIAKYEGTDVTVNIPATLGGKSVIGIGDKAFQSHSEITAVTLPNTLQSIGEDAFASCGSLLEVIIPISVVTVSIRAFFASYSLTIYCEADSKPEGWDEKWNYSDRPCYWGYISKGKEGDYSYIATKTGSYIAKYEGTDVTVNIPAKLGGQPVIGIGANVFKERSDITAVTLPTTLQSIGEYAFAYCNELLEMIIPLRITTIGNSAFAGCSALTIYCEADSKPKGWDERWNFSNRPCYWGYISKGKEGDYSYIATKTGSYIAKYEGTDVTVNIPAKLGGQPVIGIGANVFKERSDITAVTLPTTLQVVGDEAFNYCTGLLSINLPDSIVTIGERAFKDCDKLTEVTIPSSTKSIGKFAFAWCDRLSVINLTKFNDVSVLPNTDDDKTFFNVNCQFKVISEEMRDAFMAKGGGWPTEADKYIIEK